MQSAKYFDNQIIKVQNLEFQRDSTEKNIVDNFMTFSKDAGGIVNGLDLTDGGGTDLNIAQGVAYDNTGRRMELYSGITITAPSGANVIWATLAESDYNPDPTSPPPYPSFPEFGEAQVNINPVTGSGVNVSNFNTMVVSEISGTGSIPLGLVTVSGVGISGIDTSETYRQPLKLVGILNVNTSTIDGSIITLGTLDSDAFTNPLTADIYLGSGVSIFPTVSGTSKLGTTDIPFLEVDTKNLNVTNVSGLSPINVLSDISVDSSARIYSDSTELRINPSGQDTYIGDRSYAATPGTLFVNNISAWDGVLPLNPNMSISAGVLTLDLDANSGNPGLVANVAGQGYVWRTGGSSLTNVNGRIELVASGTALSKFQSENLLIQGNDTLELSGSAVEINSDTLDLTADSGLVTINSDVDVSGTLSVPEGLDTTQTFENLIPNSTFQHTSGISTTIPQIWNLIEGALSGTVNFMGSNSVDSTVTSEAEADTYFQMQVSGLTSTPGNVISIPVSKAEAGDNIDYTLSYYYKASGINATTDTTNLRINPTLSSGPSGIAGAIDTVPAALTVEDDGSWHKVTAPFSGPLTTGLENPYLAFTFNNLVGAEDYNIQFTNVQLTKGLGGPTVEANNTGSYTLLQIANKNSPGAGQGLVPQKTFYSKGQFAIITLDAPFYWGGNLTVNANGTIYLNLDGVVVRFASYQQWIYGGAGREVYSLTWHGYLAPGFHTINASVDISASTSNTGWTGGAINMTLL